MNAAHILTEALVIKGEGLILILDSAVSIAPIPTMHTPITFHINHIRIPTQVHTKIIHKFIVLANTLGTIVFPLT